MDVLPQLQSLPGVCEVHTFAPEGPPRGWVLVEVPHGATHPEEYRAVEARLASPLPEQLIHFFFVNTDIGSPEGAQAVARTLQAQGVGVVVARCLLPRTFVDVNRVLDATRAGQGVDGLTAGLPGYITAPEDARWLASLHAEYQALVDRAYAQVCGERRGLALQLHSFAPRSVDITNTDERIVEALHAAYQPEVYQRWPERPAVDLISALADGSFRAAPALVARVRAEYARDGIQAQENHTYHLHPITTGYQRARAYPEQVVCVEINRGLLARPFVPFGVSPIDDGQVERLAAPLARALGAGPLW